MTAGDGAGRAGVVPAGRGLGRIPRVGVLLPATDTGLEAELPFRLAGAASVHFARVALRSVEDQELRGFLDRAGGQLEAILAVVPDLLVVGCTSAGFVHGVDGERRRLEALERRAGVPVLSTARAMADTLLEAGRRVRLRTSYGDRLTGLEAQYLSDRGLDVVSRRGLGFTDDQRTAAVGAEQLSMLVAGGPAHHGEGAVDEDAADVVMLSCTNFRTLGIEPELEEAAGAPVVSSAQALAEGILRALRR